MTIAGMSVLVTGGNRGIGQALVEEALHRGAARVYAGTRKPLAHPDPRVTPVALDVTSADQIKAAADQVESLDILINNAGVFLFEDLSDRAALERHLAVNFYGTYDVTRAFLPALTRSRGAIVTIGSIAALAPIRSPRTTRQPAGLATGPGILGFQTYSPIGRHCYDQNRSQRHDQGHIHSNWITAIWPGKHGNHAMIKTRKTRLIRSAAALIATAAIAATTAVSAYSAAVSHHSLADDGVVNSKN